MMLAQATMEIPWHYFPPWLFGFIGFLAVVWLALGVVNAGKKLFGRRPPIDDQLKEVVKILRSEIHREKNSVLKEFKLRMIPVEARIQKSEEEIVDIQLGLARKWDELKDSIHAMALDVAVLKNNSERKTP
jgi:hypothetical protein